MVTPHVWEEDERPFPHCFLQWFYLLLPSRRCFPNLVLGLELFSLLLSHCSQRRRITSSFQLTLTCRLFQILTPSTCYTHPAHWIAHKISGRQLKDMASNF